MTSPAPLTHGSRPLSPRDVVATEMEQDPVPARRQRQPASGQPAGSLVDYSAIDVGDAVVLLRRWSQDQGSPSHLRGLVTHYRDWPAVALVLGGLTHAELSHPGRSLG